MYARKFKALFAALLTAGAVSAHANLRITEVAPWSSGNSAVGADWFEITNTGAGTIDVTGWKFDDSSNSFASAATLSGVGAIGAGRSAVFVEVGGSTTPADLIATFAQVWFNGTAPAGFTIGTYTGAGIGLSTGGDAVNLFDSGGTRRAGVTFGASPAGPSFPTFDNAAGLNDEAISQLSVAGVNGAFTAATNLNEIGSPGAIAPVPEPETYALLLVGLGLITYAVRRRNRCNGFRLAP